MQKPPRHFLYSPSSQLSCSLRVPVLSKNPDKNLLRFQLRDKMFSLKCLTKKFNRQSLSEVKPAPLSETVDHTNTPSSPFSSSKPANASTTSIYATTTTTNITPSFTAPLPMSDTTDHSLSVSGTPVTQDHPNHFANSAIPSASGGTDHGIFGGNISPPVRYNDDADDDDDGDDDLEPTESSHFLPSLPTDAVLTPSSHRSLSLSSPPLSCPSPSSSDSEEEEEEDGGDPSLLRVKGHHPHSPRKSLLKSELKIERISSAEKRKYSQYKCSTGSSSPSSSDDEIKEAFDTSSLSRLRHGPLHQHHLHHHHHHHHHHSQQMHHHPSFSHHAAWSSKLSYSSPSSSSSSSSLSAPPPPPSSPSTTSTTNSSSSSSSSDQPPPLSGWGVDPFEAAGRPLKVLPVGSRHKHKFFAQMSSGFSDRPFLDFNKMQHSKRLVMVRRPMVIRNNSRVHSIQRPSPHSFQVSLDISQHSFQPVLT